MLISRLRRTGLRSSPGKGAKINRSRLILAALVVLASTALEWAGAETCPDHLFIVARSKNANIVAYDANRGPGGDFNATEPVVAYWLLGGEKGEREELNRIERDRAYGVEAVPSDSPGVYAVVFRAHKKRLLTIRMLKGCPVATTPIDGQDGILRRVFVQSKEELVMPKVEYVEFFGENAATGAPLYEKFVPGE